MGLPGPVYFPRPLIILQKCSAQECGEEKTIKAKAGFSKQEISCFDKAGNFPALGPQSRFFQEITCRLQVFSKHVFCQSSFFKAGFWAKAGFFKAGFRPKQLFRNKITCSLQVFIFRTCSGRTCSCRFWFLLLWLKAGNFPALSKQEIFLL